MNAVLGVARDFRVMICLNRIHAETERHSHQARAETADLRTDLNIVPTSMPHLASLLAGLCFPLSMAITLLKHYPSALFSQM